MKQLAVRSFAEPSRRVHPTVRGHGLGVDVDVQGLFNMPRDSESFPFKPIYRRAKAAVEGSEVGQPWIMGSSGLQAMPCCISQAAAESKAQLTWTFIKVAQTVSVRSCRILVRKFCPI